jgi:two-component system, chemotaxis family, response regulator Rcp1
VYSLALPGELTLQFNEVRELIANILLVEDNPGDIRLTREALKEVEIGCNIHVAEDGEQALAFLRREGPHASAMRPHLILLDLNLPKLDGREVLRMIKADPELRRIPVVILTSSPIRQDILTTYDEHANCYVAKPSDVDKFEQTIRSVAEFWLKHVSLPEGPEGLLSWPATG